MAAILYCHFTWGSPKGWILCSHVVQKSEKFKNAMAQVENLA